MYWGLYWWFPQNWWKNGNFKKALRVPQGLGSKDLLFHSICHTIRFIKTNKKNAYENEQELKNDISEELFLSLFDVKDQLELDLYYQYFERQCHLINSILIKFNFFLCTYELKKIRFVTFERKR